MLTHYSTLTPEQLQRIDGITAAFEQNFRSSDAPSIESVLPQIEPELASALLVELVATEVEIRSADGESPSMNEYIERFPSDTQAIHSAFEDATADTENKAGDTDTAVGAAEATVDGLADENRERSEVETLRVIDRYQIRKTLGRGGMATVYLARDDRLHRDVAIKIPEFGNDAHASGSAQRFYREAQIMATLEHPNLCPIFDVGEHDGSPYLTMAHLTGGTLADKLEASDQMDAHQAAGLVLKLTRALAVAHGAGIIHRDLKPQNIMFNRQDEPVIMDFGLAKSQEPKHSGLTDSQTIVGTPAYMSPEQVRAEPAGPQTDVYALGVILYQMLTGKQPFTGSGYSVLGKVVSGEAPPPISRAADVHRDLQRICLKAMAHSQQDRYRSVKDLGGELSAFLDRNPRDAAGGVSAMQGKTLAILAAVSLVALIVAATTYFVRSRGANTLAGELSENPDSSIQQSQTDVEIEKPATPADGQIVAPDDPASRKAPLAERSRPTNLTEAARLMEDVGDGDGFINENFAFHCSAKLAELPTLVDMLRPLGYQPNMLKLWKKDATKRVAVVWERSPGDWKLQVGMSHDEFTAQHEAEVAAGRNLSALCTEPVGQNDRFIAVWSSQAPESQWRYLYESTNATMTFGFDEPRFEKGWRPVTVCGFYGGRFVYSIAQIWRQGQENWDYDRLTIDGPHVYDSGSAAAESSVPIDQYLVAQRNTLLVQFYSDRPFTESKVVVETQSDEHLAKCKQLAAEGWKPVSICAARDQLSRFYITSIWHRKTN